MLFEERLLFNSHDIEQTRLATLYSQSLAIREFIRFVLTVNLWDLCLDDDRCCDCDYPPAKTDNFPLFFDGQTSLKIGLIDLENVSVEGDFNYQLLLKRLVYVFPYSYGIILEEARRFVKDTQLEEWKVELEKRRDFGIKRCAFWRSDLVHYVQTRDRSNVAFQSKKEVILNELITTMKVPEDAKAEFKAYFEKFCSLLITFMATDKIKYQSVYGETYIKANTAWFTFQLRNELRSFEKKYIAENERFEKSGDCFNHFMQKMVEHRVIYHYYARGFSLCMIF